LKRTIQPFEMSTNKIFKYDLFSLVALLKRQLIVLQYIDGSTNVDLTTITMFSPDRIYYDIIVSSSIIYMGYTVYLSSTPYDNQTHYIIRVN